MIRYILRTVSILCVVIAGCQHSFGGDKKTNDKKASDEEYRNLAAVRDNLKNLVSRYTNTIGNHDGLDAIKDAYKKKMMEYGGPFEYKEWFSAETQMRMLKREVEFLKWARSYYKEVIGGARVRDYKEPHELREEEKNSSLSENGITPKKPNDTPDKPTPKK